MRKLMIVSGILLALIIVALWIKNTDPPAPRSLAVEQEQATQRPSLSAVATTAPPPAVLVDDRPRTSNGKDRIDIESGCRGLIIEKVDNIEWPGWRDTPLGQPVVTSHGAVWKGWFRTPNAFGVKMRHTFACRYIAKTDMLSVRFDE